MNEYSTLVEVILSILVAGGPCNNSIIRPTDVGIHNIITGVSNSSAENAPLLLQLLLLLLLLLLLQFCATPPAASVAAVV